MLLLCCSQPSSRSTFLRPQSLTITTLSIGLFFLRRISWESFNRRVSHAFVVCAFYWDLLLERKIRLSFFLFFFVRADNQDHGISRLLSLPLEPASRASVEQREGDKQCLLLRAKVAMLSAS